MLGRWYYLFRRKFGYGLYTAWKRDVTRWRILQTKPVCGLTDDTCEIHALTCHGDWIDLVWALKTFCATSGVRYRVCIHEDGSVTPDAMAAIRYHFPDARLISRKEADAKALVTLRSHPRCHALRDSNVLSLKVFDFANYLESDRMMLLDSDILFFQSPDALLHRIADTRYRKNSLNRDWGMGYSIDPEIAQTEVPFPIQSHINSGLGLMHKASYDFDSFEQWLKLPGILSHQHRIEQTLVGLACSRFGHEFLPAEYDVSANSTESDAVLKHYTGPIRHLMYKEGLNRASSIIEKSVSFKEIGHWCRPHL